METIRSRRGFAVPMDVRILLDIGPPEFFGMQFLKAIFTVLGDELALNLEERS